MNTSINDFLILLYTEVKTYINKEKIDEFIKQL